MILLIDNYDSFSYNLFQLIGEIEPDIRVIRNDEMTAEEIKSLEPDHIILSPGPGRPEDAGVIVEVAKTLGTKIPVLGVCLGHQAICAAFGATDTIPECLKVAALTEDGEIMAVWHKEYPIYGVQFHPESIMTPDGKQMIRNFIKEI